MNIMYKNRIRHQFQYSLLETVNRIYQKQVYF